jgi:hypothetical protein
MVQATVMEIERNTNTIHNNAVSINSTIHISKKGMIMARSFFVFTIALFVASSLCFAQNITGKWKGQMESPNGAMELTFNLTAAGDSLTGTVASQMGEMPISNGKVHGSVFSFDVDANGMTVSHQCVIANDTVTLKVAGFQGGDDMKMILTRVQGVKKD